jgi:bacillolysin
MRQTRWLVPFVATSLAIAAQAQGQSEAIDPAGVARLVADSGGTAQVSIHGATGAARFVRVEPGGTLGVRVFGRALGDDAKKNRTVQFLNKYRGIFGISSVTTELGPARIDKDRQGATHLTYKQVHHGVPVFGGELKAHFNPAGDLTAVNGTFIPGIAVDPSPIRSAEQAGSTAITAVAADLGRKVQALTAKATLVIFREGLAQGVPGENHLAWQVEVGNKADVREFVYVDAHSGKIIDRIAGIHEALNRRAFDGIGATAPGPNYPNTPFWVEGSPFPTGVVEADNMILASLDIYNLFKKAFGRDSYDGAGATMDSIFNRGNACPNASWGGQFISFCPGTTTDDVTAHEWGHAYTEFTHGLIYQWQPGALNEAYSDIWGETVDRINGRGGDTPDAARSAGVCTVSTPNPPTVLITAPVSLAGPRSAGSASFGPATFSISGDVVAVSDGVGTASDGCETPFVNAAAVNGRIALIDRGTCGFAVKAKNAQLNGAIGVIIGNNVAGAAPGLGGTDATVTIPTLSLSQADSTAIKAQLPVSTVTVALTRGGNGTDNSVRWLIGEDSSAFGGAIRDMYNPTCYGNPGKVSDAQYACSTADSGGVHGNSGVPNHGYALLVDGGVYNGQSIAPIGLTKAAHIYYRAQSVYQGPASGFPDHADAIAQSCSDLTGVNLASLSTGAPSGERISATDCAQVAKVALAVEFRTPPSQCNFQPLLAQSPPAACEAGTTQTALLSDGFDGGKRTGVRWLVSHAGTADFTARDWGVVKGLPGNRPGVAIFAADYTGGTCGPGGDESGVMRLESPEITIPAGAPTRLSFDHWVATEAGFDGGNVKISVNGGAWTLVRGADFIYNPYNTTLTSVAGGNSNPMAGEAAFSGSDGGSVNGSWGRSIVNLAPYAVAGDRVKLRFDLGTDGCGGTFGWYLDDIKVYSCRP